MTEKKKEPPKVIFDGTKKLTIFPTSENHSFEDLLRKLVWSEIEIKPIISGWTYFGMSDLSIAILKGVAIFLAFIEKIVKPLGISVRIKNGIVKISKGRNEK